ncbi:MAG: imidazoleglycerol-phosphate dehydratase HisB [Desulfobacterales bacterium]|nr:imidazoleglycerol-phosphate dehydratase HisB [Desulfobacterales bacterium]
MARTAEIERKTKETQIRLRLGLDGSPDSPSSEISTGLPFFDHMLTLFAAHGFFELTVEASGDIDVDCHHTVEDIGLVLGDAIDQALGDRKGIGRYGHAVTPMDDALSMVTIDLSNRPFLIYNIPGLTGDGRAFDVSSAKEFFRALANRAGMNLHINVHYGENAHHVLESVFKSAGRALCQAVAPDPRIKGVRSTKGTF